MALGSISPRIEVFAQGTAASRSIIQTIRRVPPIDSLGDGGEQPKDIKGEIEFRDVGFIYPSRPEGNIEYQSRDRLILQFMF